MQASRLLSILMLLQARGRMTTAALAQALEVSQRTILRDVDQLSAAGVPLWAERGRQGGLVLRDGWSTQLTGMTEPESQALLLAGLPGPATALGLGAAAASARLKMLASLPSAWRDQAARVGERLHIDPTDWYRTQDTPHFLREVADAVWHGRRLSIDYQSWRAALRRDVEPLGLVLKAGAWYLLARTVGQTAFRTYRLSSLRAVQVGTQSFVRPRQFSLARAWDSSAARFEAELHPLQARARVSPRCWTWLTHARIPVVHCSTPARTRVAESEWKEVLIPIESIDHGARQLMAYGAEIEVLEPTTLRQAIYEQACLLVDRHQSGAGSQSKRRAMSTRKAR